MARKDISVLLDRGFRPRSALGEWLRENHDAFFERISRQVPDWAALAAAFAEAGLTNRYGKPPQAEATRKLWRQIHREVTEERARKSPRARPDPRPEPDHPPPPQTPTQTSTDDILAKMRNRNKLPDPLT